jgi:hypothetical protein
VKKYSLKVILMEPEGKHSTEIVKFFERHPKFVLEWVSCFFPLPIEWLRKYVDILWWGERQSVDYDDIMSSSTKTSYIWTPGIIFNTKLIWTDEVRAFVLSMLLWSGGELGLRKYLWGDFWKDRHFQKDKLLADMEISLDFVSICPIKCGDPEISRFDLIPPGSLPQLNPKTDEIYSWQKLKSHIASSTLPLSYGIWDKSVSQFLSKEIVYELLNIFYLEHLKIPIDEVDDNNEELPF